MLQGVKSNFDIDIFQKIISSLKTQCPFQMKPVALKVVADHLRAMVFLIADQVYPSNEGRGYVLRRIMRRAMRFGYQDGARLPFLFQFVDLVCQVMASAMDELPSMSKNITQIVEREERLFLKHWIKDVRCLRRICRSMIILMVNWHLSFMIHLGSH